MKNGKGLWFQALVDSRYTYIGIDEQLVKEERIKIKPADISFKVFNTDGTKNEEVIIFAPLEVEINRYKEQIDVVVTDLNSMDIFLEHDWLVKHNPEINWDKGMIWFTRCPKTCWTTH